MIMCVKESLVNVSNKLIRIVRIMDIVILLTELGDGIVMSV
jgi:hypothetical protein